RRRPAHRGERERTQRAAPVPGHHAPGRPGGGRQTDHLRLRVVPRRRGRGHDRHRRLVVRPCRGGLERVPGRREGRRADQPGGHLDARHAPADKHPDLDLSRVAMRGWSFGGWLSGLAVLRRPDVYHAAVVGAPVTDWELYDTAYTERYLGLPADGSDVYAHHSLVELAAEPPARSADARPMLLIHGMVDDNVVAAHTLRLSE